MPFPKPARPQATQFLPFPMMTADAASCQSATAPLLSLEACRTRPEPVAQPFVTEGSLTMLGRKAATFVI